MTKKLFYSIALIFIFIVVVFSCKKKDNPLGTDVQPASDAINSVFSDSAKVYFHTVGYDSSRSYGDGFKYIGSNQDAIFGRTDASIFTNFSLPDNISDVSFGDDAVLDSCGMILAFTQSFVGDTTTPLTYNVYQLAEPVGASTSYYMFNGVSPLTSTLATHPTPICNSKARVTYTQGFYALQLPINYQFAASILNNPQYLINNAAFQAAYKGFFITTKHSSLNPSAPGALMKVDLDNPISGVYLYYHNGSSSAAKGPKQYRLSFSGNSAACFNKVDYYPNSGSNTNLFEQLSGDTAKGATSVFLKGLGGTRGVLRFPYIKNYADSFRISVSRAEVILRVDQTYSTSPSVGEYDAPLQISLVAIDSLKREIFVKDQYFTSPILFGGDYNSDTQEYTFNIARHMQDIVDGKIRNLGFYVVVANPDRSYVTRRDDKAERVILGGYKHPIYYPEIKLTYVKFPHDK
ncbi:MAG: DUF4270 family protein [Bacteroidia bacterium]